MAPDMHGKGLIGRITLIRTTHVPHESGGFLNIGLPLRLVSNNLKYFSNVMSDFQIMPTGYDRALARS
ncbi:hypothetical protein [Pantoea ananatis]|uniref:hypothetical protein n=1 Tax=Pantoea ananas TaxID=553 RepID=UPI001B30480C|nr:hypothetical protein [Pantoea ananatis]